MYYWTMSFVIILSFFLSFFLSLFIYLFIYLLRYIADINKLGFGHWELATGH